MLCDDNCVVVPVMVMMVVALAVVVVVVVVHNGDIKKEKKCWNSILLGHAEGSGGFEC